MGIFLVTNVFTCTLLRFLNIPQTISQYLGYLTEANINFAPHIDLGIDTGGKHHFSKRTKHFEAERFYTTAQAKIKLAGGF